MGQTILIVEDHEKNRRLLRDVLSYYGYTIIEAENGKEGIEMARQYMPDLILMDIQMPVMDGFTATTILKSAPETKEIKIVAVTSFAMTGDKEKILDTGADGYISKPLDIKALPTLIKDILFREPAPVSV